jgi:hypothetical protein
MADVYLWLIIATDQEWRRMFKSERILTLAAVPDDVLELLQVVRSVRPHPLSRTRPLAPVESWAGDGSLKTGATTRMAMNGKCRQKTVPTSIGYQFYKP